MLFTVVDCGRGDDTDVGVSAGEGMLVVLGRGRNEQASMKKTLTKITLRFVFHGFIMFSPLIRLIVTILSHIKFA
jgi:hypothetical protein